MQTGVLICVARSGPVPCEGILDISVGCMQNACWLVTLFAVSKPRSPGKFQRIQPVHSRDAGNAGSQTNRLRPWLRAVIASPQAKGQRLRLQRLADRRKSHQAMPGKREP